MELNFQMVLVCQLFFCRSPTVCIVKQLAKLYEQDLFELRQRIVSRLVLQWPCALLNQTGNSYEFMFF